MGIKLKSDHIKSVHIKSVHIKSVQIKSVHIKSVHIKSVHIKSDHIKSVHIKSVYIKSDHIERLPLKLGHFDSPDSDGEICCATLVDGEYLISKQKRLVLQKSSVVLFTITFLKNESAFLNTYQVMAGSRYTATIVDTETKNVKLGFPSYHQTLCAKRIFDQMQI